MKLRRAQAGFAGLEIILVVVAIVFVGYVAYKVYDANQVEQALNNEKAKVAEENITAPSITTAKDLTTAEQTLDRIDPEAINTDGAELDNELAAF